ncbi:MAG: type II toxin-antitoxin system RelE/ParE family toxin [Beijerinckiaceae bacterium]|jgi:proteic killer suppression protein
MLHFFMIESFNHKGLKRLFEDDDRKLLRADLVERISVLLAYLDAAKVIDDLDIPSLRLHPLKGELKGFWAITVRANWRIIFRFADGAASAVELIDYH